MFTAIISIVLFSIFIMVLKNNKLNVFLNKHSNIIGIVILSFALIILCFLLIDDILNYKKFNCIKNPAYTTGLIENVDVIKNEHISESDTYNYDITIKYSVNDINYYNYFKKNWFSSKYASNTFDSNPKVKVKYDKNNPSHSIIDDNRFYYDYKFFIGVYSISIVIISTFIFFSLKKNYKRSN